MISSAVTVNNAVLSSSYYSFTFPDLANSGMIVGPNLTFDILPYDTTPPVITLNGANPQTVYRGTAFTDLGATVTDDFDATRTITGSGTVDTSTVGSYTLTYSTQDEVGNVATPVTRTVNVVLNPTGDEDNDGLNNTEEANLGTDPYLRDTDSDGVNDLREVGDATDPLNPASFNSLSKGLVAYYPFNGNAKDESGSGNDGAPFDATLAEDRDGASGSAYNFNGDSSFISVQNSQTLSSFAFEMSVSCWVLFREPNRGDWRNLVSKYRATTDSPNNGFMLRTGTAGIRPQVLFAEFGGVPHEPWYEADFVASYPDWVHITAVSKGGQTSLFLNGIKVATGPSGSAYNNTDPLTIGGQNGNFGARQHFGELDDIRIYNRALSASEVGLLFASEKYSGFGLEGAATKSPFNPTTAANWSAGGSAWSVDTAITHDGVDSVKAQTTNNQSTYREYTVAGPAVVDFWWKVSSEKTFDTFSYSLNGVNQATISGEVDWTYRTLTLPAGTHTMRWTYAKDASDAVGQDAGWLDEFAVNPAEARLTVHDGSTPLSGTTTVDFGSAALESASPTKTLVFANEGFVPLEAQLSLPAGCPFTFEEGGSTYDLFLGRGESTSVTITLSTATAGTKSAQLSISAPDSVVAPPTATLQGVILGQKIGVAQGATPLSSGQSVDMGMAPRTLQFTVSNTGNVGNLLLTAAITGNFQITQQLPASVAPQSSATFTVLAQATAFGSQTGGITITSNDPDTPTFIIPLTAKSFAVGNEGIRSGSVATSGSGGAVGWSLATTLLPSGQSGSAIKTGVTPNNGGSVLEFTAQTAGTVSWSWKVSAQQDFDWLLCEVDGQEAAGISTKNGAWQTQVVQVPAGANIRWIYRKDASASAGEDAGYLADVAFRSFGGNTSFAPWAQSHGIAEPQQRMPKSGIMNMFAWLGGFDPAVGPDSTHYVPFIEGGRLKYRFPISKVAEGTQQLLFSSDMNSWTARGFSQRVLSEDANAMVIEATAPSGTKGFFKVVGTGDTSMVEVQGGTLPQTSGLAGTAVATFRIGTTEVTWGEWQEVRAWAVTNGYTDLAGIGAGTAPEHPVHSVSWYDAVKWCNAKSEMAGLTPCYQAGGAIYRTGKSAPTVNSSANGYRLPTEAEWEWAARGGVRSQGYGYSGGDTVDEVAWYNGNSSGSTKNVGTKKANELGLYDMSGNVWEWYEEFNRGGIRGGGYSNVYQECTVGLRGSFDVGATNPNIGFRVSRNSE